MQTAIGIDREEIALAIGKLWERRIVPQFNVFGTLDHWHVEVHRPNLSSNFSIGNLGTFTSGDKARIKSVHLTVCNRAKKFGDIMDRYTYLPHEGQLYEGHITLSDASDALTVDQFIRHCKSSPLGNEDTYSDPDSEVSDKLWAHALTELEFTIATNTTTSMTDAGAFAEEYIDKLQKDGKLTEEYVNSTSFYFEGLNEFRRQTRG